MVTVHSEADAVSRYRRLLVSEWTKTYPHEVISLLWETLGERSADNESEPIIRLLDPGYHTSFPTEFFQSIVKRISEATKFVNRGSLPALPSEYWPQKKLPSVVWQANRLTTYLTLPAHTTVAGNEDFFADIRALAFQAAIHVVLPTLRERHTAEHSLLLHSALLFSLGYSTYDPAHCAYMMSMIHGYMGDEEQRLQSLYASFRFTSPQDHSYLTKAQEFWTELLDNGKYKETEQFLFSLHWWSLPTQQDEVREMIVQAFKYILRTKKHIA